MRLASFWADGGPRLGVVVDDSVLDLESLAKTFDCPVYPDIHALMADGADGLRILEGLMGRAAGHPEMFRPLSSLQLAPCVPRPGKIICVGLNYRPHAVEAQMDVPTQPILFSKFNNALAGSGQTVPMPAEAVQIDYEAELAIVIGRRAQGVQPAEARGYVFGYCNANDLSARDLQFRSSQWLLGKTLDGFCPIGPWVATADEVADPKNLTVRCYVNGEERQRGNTAEMIFDCDYLVSYISRSITLEPGDLILTGTPEGVVLGYPPERRQEAWLKAGDVVEVEIEGLGRLVNRLGAPA